MQRGSVLLKQGDFDEAKADFQNVVCRLTSIIFLDQLYINFSYNQIHQTLKHTLNLISLLK